MGSEMCIRDRYDNLQLQAERLRQSILKRAFEGRLVPQDPADEPAERLLERIKAEKAKNSGLAKSKKRGVEGVTR